MAAEAVSDSEFSENRAFGRKSEAKMEGKPNQSAMAQNENLETADFERKLIKTANIEFKTEDIEKTQANIEKLIQKYKAYVSQENGHSSRYRIMQTLIIRIPKENFDLFITELAAGVERFDSKNIDVQDVTEDFIDISARLRVKKETENTYLKLLNKAASVKDILDIQDQIQALRSEIESLEGRLKYLEKSVNFSTVTISMYQLTDLAGEGSSIFFRIKTALSDGLSGFFQFVLGMLQAWVFILIAIILFVIVKAKWKKRKTKNSDNTGQQTNLNNSEQI